MESNELPGKYENIRKKQEIYKKTTKFGKILIWLGLIILFSLIYNTLPWILSSIFKFEINDNVIVVFILLGFVLIIIGSKKIKNATKAIDFRGEEEEFMKVYESIQDIKLFQKEKTEFLKFEAAKKLSKVEQKIKEPAMYSSSIWDWLAKEEIENLRLLKKNIKEILIPNIIQSDEEDIKKVDILLEKFAQNLLNPTATELKNLNDSIAKLPKYVSEETPLFPFLKYPYMRHVYFVILFAVSGYIAYHSGISIGTSIDTAYSVGFGLFGVLTAGYMVFIVRNS